MHVLSVKLAVRRHSFWPSCFQYVDVRVVPLSDGALRLKNFTSQKVLSCLPFVSGAGKGMVLYREGRAIGAVLGNMCRMPAIPQGKGIMEGTFVQGESIFFNW